MVEIFYAASISATSSASLYMAMLWFERHAHFPLAITVISFAAPLTMSVGGLKTQGCDGFNKESQEYQSCLKEEHDFLGLLTVVTTCVSVASLWLLVAINCSLDRRQEAEAESDRDLRRNSSVLSVLSKERVRKPSSNFSESLRQTNCCARACDNLK